MRRISRRCNEVPSASSLLFPAPTGQSVRTGNEIRITQAGHPTEQSPIADIAITRSAECRSWVKDGKTPIEHMFCGLPGIADIIENVGVSIALHLTEQSALDGSPALTRFGCHFYRRQASQLGFNRLETAVPQCSALAGNTTVALAVLFGTATDDAISRQSRSTSRPHPSAIRRSPHPLRAQSKPFALTRLGRHQ